MTRLVGFHLVRCSWPYPYSRLVRNVHRDDLIDAATEARDSVLDLTGKEARWWTWLGWTFVVTWKEEE